jgi:hypothetical protein
MLKSSVCSETHTENVRALNLTVAEDLFYLLRKFSNLPYCNIRAAAFLEGLRGSEVPIFFTFDTTILY